jgi:hypothetical protein
MRKLIAFALVATSAALIGQTVDIPAKAKVIQKIVPHFCELGINFGAFFAPTNEAGTVVLMPGSDTPIYTGVTPKTIFGWAPHRGAFGAIKDVELATEITDVTATTLDNGGEHMVLTVDKNTHVSFVDGIGNPLMGGFVGGSLAVGVNQKPGAYSGTVTITVGYVL